MPLSEDFQKEMERLKIPSNSRLLVAVSGGLDSISLLHLAKAAGYDVAAAHANFKLRGADSDADQALVEGTCAKLKIPVFTKILEIDKARESVQIRARELRYNWFFELMDIESYDFLLTAHHQNDRIETFFINILRGSGIKGLKSIPERTGRIVRPLLPFEKSEIEAFAKSEGIEWREDISNASDDYLRNKIRHTISKSFSELSDSANVNFAKSMDFLAEADAFFENQATLFIADLPNENGIIRIKDSLWNSLFQSKPLHKYVLEHLGFQPSQFADLENFGESQSGKFIEGSRHKVYRDRRSFLLEPIAESSESKIEINSKLGRISKPISLEWERMTATTDFRKAKNVANLDFDKLSFPLLLRKWKPGDRFQPLGMKGVKKISDFLTDLKLSIPEKNRIYVVESNGEICWVVGLRVSETFKARENGSDYFRIEFSNPVK